jgi:phosphate transport system substrate-binding protein
MATSFFPALLAAAVFSGVLSAGTAGAGTAGAGDGPAAIRVGGTGSALRTLDVLGSAFAAAGGPAVNVVPNLGSSGGIKALRSGAIDLAVIARHPTPAEADGLATAEYAQTAFVFAVGQQPVEGITIQQLVDLYSGTVTRWPGGDQVRVVLRPETDSDSQAIRSLSPALSRALGDALMRNGMVMAFTDQDAADAIATIPGAIGPTTLAIVKAERRPLKVLALDGVQPGVEALADGRYAHTRSFHVLWKPDGPPGAGRFVAFLRSPQAKPMLEDLGQRQIAP